VKKVTILKNIFENCVGKIGFKRMITSLEGLNEELNNTSVYSYISLAVSDKSWSIMVKNERDLL